MKAGFFIISSWQQPQRRFTLLIFWEYCDNIHRDAAQDAFCAVSGKTHKPDLTVQTLFLTERRVA
jgi:hypothetical protein